jgi:hypothetical protein
MLGRYSVAVTLEYATMTVPFDAFCGVPERILKDNGYLLDEVFNETMRGLEWIYQQSGNISTRDLSNIVKDMLAAGGVITDFRSRQGSDVLYLTTRHR